MPNKTLRHGQSATKKGVIRGRLLEQLLSDVGWIIRSKDLKCHDLGLPALRIHRACKSHINRRPRALERDARAQKWIVDRRAAGLPLTRLPLVTINTSF